MLFQLMLLLVYGSKIVLQDEQGDRQRREYINAFDLKSSQR